MNTAAEENIIDGFSFVERYKAENNKRKIPNNFDYSGLTFNYLTVLEEVEQRKHRRRYKAKCKCGNVKEYCIGKIVDGHTKSCGCYIESNKSENHKIAYSEIKKSRRLYGIYADMKSRCLNKNLQAYPDYGGRGIVICDEWLGKEGYTNFYMWSISNGYAENLEIDRIDVNGNYCPENCRWVNEKEQANNRRNNHYVEFFGEIHTVTEWAEIFNINMPTFQARIRQNCNIQKLFTRRINYMITPAAYQNLIEEHKEEMKKNPESAKRKMVADTVTVMKQFGYDCGIEDLLNAFKNGENNNDDN